MKLKSINLSLRRPHQVLVDLELIRNLPTKLRRLGITDSIVRKTDELLDRLGRLDEVIGGRSVLQHVQYILDETKKYQSLLAQALHDLQTNRQQVEQDKDFIYRAENQTREILSQINQALVNLQVSQQKVETNKQAVEEANRNTGEILQQINQALSDLRVSQQKVETDKQIIQDIEDRIKRTLEQAHQVLVDLELIRNLPTKLRELGITDSIVRKTDELLDRSIALSRQLEECRQETMAIREFEEYVRQFRKYRSGRQLRSFLYRELGFAGLVVYILHLLAPRRRNG
jgi:chromosome segregation ATPase